MTNHKHDEDHRDSERKGRDDETWTGPSSGREAPKPHHRHEHHGHHRLAPPPHHGGHGPKRREFGISFDDSFSSHADSVLGMVLSQGVVSWLLRAASFGPPEIVAIFKVQVAAIATVLDRFREREIETPWLQPNDIQGGESTRRSMAGIMTDNETAACLHNLFRGPDEVQAIAFLSLVVLRLTAADPAAQQEEA